MESLFSENLASILDDGDFIQLLGNEPFHCSGESLGQLESPEILYDSSFTGAINVSTSSPPLFGEVFIKTEKPDEQAPPIVNSPSNSISQIQVALMTNPNSNQSTYNPDGDVRLSKRASQNRVASRNYRKRKKQYVEDLEEQLRQMILENQRLRRQQYFAEVQISSLAEENSKTQQSISSGLCTRDPVEETAAVKQLETLLSTGASNDDLFAIISSISGMCTVAIQKAILDLKSFITPSFLIQYCFNSPEEEEEEETMGDLTELFKKEALPRMGFSQNQIQQIGATYPTYKQQLFQLKTTRKHLADELKNYLIQRHLIRTKQTSSLSSGNILSAVDAVIGASPPIPFEPNTREAKRPYLSSADRSQGSLVSDEGTKQDPLSLPVVESSINVTMEKLRQNLLDEQGLYMFHFRQVSAVLSVPQQAMFVLFMRKRLISCSQTIKILWTLFAADSTQITFPKNSPLILK